MGKRNAPFEIGDRVRVDWPTSRMHGETGEVKQLRDEGSWWTVLVSSEQFPHLEPMWYGDQALKPLARLDADKTAKPKTEIRGVFPDDGKCRALAHDAKEYVVVPTDGQREGGDSG